MFSSNQDPSLHNLQVVEYLVLGTIISQEYNKTSLAVDHVLLENLQFAISRTFKKLAIRDDSIGKS
jgi:hypothetical protein